MLDVCGRAERTGRRGRAADAAFVDPRDRQQHRRISVVSRPWAVLTTAARWEHDPARGIALVDHAKQTRAVRQEDLQRSFGRHSGCWGQHDHPHAAAAHRGPCAVRAGTPRGVSAATGRGHRLQAGPHRPAADGQAVEIDIAFPDRRIAIELDGYAFHSGAEAFRKDVRRGNKLLADGWTVRRFTRDDLVSDEFIDVVRELLCG